MKALNKQATQNLKAATLVIHSQAIKELTNVSGGETETRYKPKRSVKVSKPGDAPNTDTGTGRQSIGFNVDEQRNKSEVGTGLKYMKFLELGTRSIAARPWLTIALKKSESTIKKLFKKTPRIP